uniref:Membrane-associated protein n=1 Tax=Plectus sambesii TaxID=2011161 RepID=A0A914XEQ2_9BILA
MALMGAAASSIHDVTNASTTTTSDSSSAGLLGSADNNRTLVSSVVQQTVMSPVPYGRLLETHAVAEDHATFVIGMILLIAIAFCFCALLTRLTKTPTLYQTICYSRISRNEIVAWIRLDEETAARRTTQRKLPSFVVFLHSVIRCVRPTLLPAPMSASVARTDITASPSSSSSSRMLMQQRWSIASLPSYDIATTASLTASLTASTPVRTETPPPRYEDVTEPFVDGDAAELN